MLEPQVLETLNQVTREATVVSQAAHEDEINISGEPTLAPRLMPSSPVSRFAQLPSGRNLTTPRFDEAFTRDTQTLKVDCDAERAKLKNISKLTATITPEPGDFPPECGPKEEQYYPRDWCMLTYTWKASNLCHKPLYFEDVQAERYGHVWPRPLQPFVSGGLFFGTVVMLPYRMGIELPNECVYDLGYYRPGSCAPYQIPGFPISLRGALFECGAVAVGLATVPGTAGLTAAQAAAAANGRVLIIP